MRLFTTQHAEGRWVGLGEAAAADSPQTMVLAFGAREHGEDGGALAGLAHAFPRSVVVGCSTAGEIVGPRIADGTITVAAVRFDHSWITQACARVASAADSFSAGRDIASRLAAPTLRAVLVLSDGLNVNGSELVRGLNSSLPASVVVTGGLAGDGDRMQKTWVFADGEARSGLVVAVGLHGDRLSLGHGSKGGWDIFGVERLVTRSRGNVLYELDGKPALELYKKYLGDRAAGLPASALLFPLAIRASAADDKTLVRTVLAVDEAEQSMTFAGDVPEGWRAQLMRANMDRLIRGAAHAALSASASRGQGDSLCVAISCVGRRLVLGQRAEEEVEAVCESLPAVTGQVGFYSYGEISPYASGRCDLHNQTMTLTTIAER